MDILFDGVGIDCNREELEASVVCPNLASEKQIKVINDTFYSISLFGGVSKSFLNENQNFNLKLSRKMQQVLDVLKSTVVSKILVKLEK